MRGLKPRGGAEALDRRLDALERGLNEADARLLEMEGSPLVRALRKPGELLHDWRGRIGHGLLYSPLHPLYLRLLPPHPDEAYERWVERRETQSLRPRVLSPGPVISVVLPVRDPRREWLAEAVESVRRQSLPCWELCVCDDASRAPWVAEYFEAVSAEDPRVRFVRSETCLGISAATNRAGELAGGEYIGFLGQNGVLAPTALEEVAEALRSGPADLVYTDEDLLGPDGRRSRPVFKPAWSPELLLSCMYLGQFLVARREALDRIGWLRSALDGGQDYDMALRLTEGRGAVRHIPRVLYHRHGQPESWCSGTQSSPDSHAAGFRALAESAARRGLYAEVRDGPHLNTYRLRRRAPGRLLASIVVCSRNGRLLERCLRAIESRTAYDRREVVVVHHLTGDDRSVARAAARHGCTRVCYSGPFDFATMCNQGARAAAGEVLVFLNDDVSPLAADWLEALVAQAMRPEVAVVGARLLYPHGGIQHAGMAIGIGFGVGHPQRHTFGSGYWNWWLLARNVSAVTGACLAIRRAVFDELGGFDPVFPVNYNDADLCLRAIRAGYHVIYEPAAVLAHAECSTRRPGVRYAERLLWTRRWGEWLEGGDPYYSPNLTDQSEEASLNPAPDPARCRWR